MSTTTGTFHRWAVIVGLSLLVTSGLVLHWVSLYFLVGPGDSRLFWIETSHVIAWGVPNISSASHWLHIVVMGLIWTPLLCVCYASPKFHSSFSASTTDLRWSTLFLLAATCGWAAGMFGDWRIGRDVTIVLSLAVLSLMVAFYTARGLIWIIGKRRNLLLAEGQPPNVAAY
jgi:hypothetical protein